MFYHCFSKSYVVYFSQHLEERETILWSRSMHLMQKNRMADPDNTGEALSRRSRTVRKAEAHSQGDTAYAELKRRIIHCALAPGERFTEAQLASETGIGKTPVREALTRLIQEGLV